MRASGDLVEIVACLSRSDQCVNRSEVSRALFRPQVFGGMELGMGSVLQTGLCLIDPGEEHMTVDTEFEQR